MKFQGVLFFPVTPFGADGSLDRELLARHIEAGVAAGAGGVFVACGTGEFHALTPDEIEQATRIAVATTAGRVPVLAAAGGPLPVAVDQATRIREAGADGILLLPPYLVTAPQQGLVRYAREVTSAAGLPVIFYQRGTARLTEATAAEIAALPGVVGLKDGIGDLERMHRIVRAIRVLPGGEDFAFFNGLPTAEMTAAAYQGVGVDLYSSAVFAFAPEIATAFHRALGRVTSPWSPDSSTSSTAPRRTPRRGTGIRGVPDQGRSDPPGPGRRRRPRPAARPDAGARGPAGETHRPRSGGGPRMSGTGVGTRIRELVVTPIAFGDPPLLNADGVHEPLALRCILQLVLEDGTVGLGESPGGTARLERLQEAAKAVVGMDVFDTTAISAAIDAVLSPTVPSSHERGWVTSAVEVACLDAQGKLLGRPVSDLLGGKVRDAVPFAAYLFYKWAEHPALDGREAIGDEWGEALDPAGVVAQARLMQQRYGFTSFKLKGGVFPPDEEIAAMKALAEAFPGRPLRLDPNTAWSVETSKYVARELDGVIEYLEDPTATIPGMAEVARKRRCRWRPTCV